MERKDKYDFLVDLGKAFDGKNGVVDCRGLHIGSKCLINTEGCDFTGSVLYKCTPKLPNPEAFQIGSLSESYLFSTISFKGDLGAPINLTNYVFDNIIARGTWTLYHIGLLNSRIADSHFSDMRLFGCSFIDMEFDRVELAISEIAHSFFTNCLLGDTTLTYLEERIYSQYNTFRNCTIRNVKFVGFKLGEDTQVETTNLEDVEFVDCIFNGAVFYNTEFADVKFTNCKFVGIEFYGCKYRGSLDGISPHEFLSEDNMRRID